MYKEFLKKEKLKKKNHCYRLHMISETQKQPLETRQTATIVTCAATPPEVQSYQKKEPANTVTRGTTGATVDSTKSILKLKKQIGKSENPFGLLFLFI